MQHRMTIKIALTNYQVNINRKFYVKESVVYYSHENITYNIPTHVECKHIDCIRMSDV